jgi:hypothetical protein
LFISSVLIFRRNFFDFWNSLCYLLKTLSLWIFRIRYKFDLIFLIAIVNKKNSKQAESPKQT